MATDKHAKIVIVGAGCFGLSTAYHLLRRGYTAITILDRSQVLPAPDAASTDINKIVRSSYAESYYTQLARDAIAEWKNTDEWKDTYRESGVVVLGAKNVAYADKAYQNDISHGCRIQNLESPEDIRSVFPGVIETDAFTERAGYINRDGGWAFAAQGIRIMQSKVESLGGKVIPAKAVSNLIQKDGKTVGVNCEDGSSYDADLVVIASGSWTASAFPGLHLEEKCLATGQSVATVQLTPEEGERYKDCPVFLDFSTGFYIFPPNDDNIVKMSIHCSGHTFTQPLTNDPSHSPISTPRTSLSHGENGLRVPRDLLRKIRTNLRSLYPELAGKPFSSTRMCWYTDSPDDDWVISRHPSDQGIILATSGSGHAYKFLPNIGGIVADLIEDKLEPILVQKFAVDRQRALHDLSRTGEKPEELDVNELCTPEDLLP